MHGRWVLAMQAFHFPREEHQILLQSGCPKDALTCSLLQSLWRHTLSLSGLGRDEGRTTLAEERPAWPAQPEGLVCLGKDLSVLRETKLAASAGPREPGRSSPQLSFLPCLPHRGQFFLENTSEGAKKLLSQSPSLISLSPAQVNQLLIHTKGELIPC